ncbi:MAG: prenyltransferase [Bacteroides sp.]|nr:prenyltransferase [Ruminococcus flavefaciens]MCM1554603.1 prenyltransferase [Bacteroides sp.]
MSNRIAFWYHNARPISLPQSLLPAITALAAASGMESFSWLPAVLAVVGVGLAHLGMNLADDWFDYRVHFGEVRQELASDGIRARIVKYPYLTSSEATPRQLLAATAVFLFLAACIGAVLTWMRGLTIVYLTLAAFVIGISYSGKPFRLGFRGWGEAVIFLMFGPLCMAGVFYAATGVFSAKIAWISVSVGLLVANIVYTHSIMDAAPDRRMGKFTMAHLMGGPAGQLVLSGIFNLVPYVLITVGVLLKQLHPAYLAVWVVFPLSVWLIRSLYGFCYGNKDESLQTRWWVAPKKDFEAYRSAGVEWFMLRWLTSRNIIMFFCFILMAVSFIFPETW